MKAGQSFNGVAVRKVQEAHGTGIFVVERRSLPSAAVLVHGKAVKHLPRDGRGPRGGAQALVQTQKRLVLVRAKVSVASPERSACRCSFSLCSSSSSSIFLQQAHLSEGLLRCEHHEALSLRRHQQYAVRHSFSASSSTSSTASSAPRPPGPVCELLPDPPLPPGLHSRDDDDRDVDEAVHERGHVCFEVEVEVEK